MSELPPTSASKSGVLPAMIFASVSAMRRDSQIPRHRFEAVNFGKKSTLNLDGRKVALLSDSLSCRLNVSLLQTPGRRSWSRHGNDVCARPLSVQHPIQPDVVFGHATRRKPLVKPATNA